MTSPSPQCDGLGLAAGPVAPVGSGDAGVLVAGDCPVPTGLGDVGEASGEDVGVLSDVGEGLPRRVVGDGVGVRVGVGVGVGDDTCVSFDPFDPFEPLDALAGRTTRYSARTARNSTISTTVEVRTRPIRTIMRRLRSTGRYRVPR